MAIEKQDNLDAIADTLMEAGLSTNTPNKGSTGKDSAGKNSAGKDSEGKDGTGKGSTGKGSMNGLQEQCLRKLDNAIAKGSVL